MLRNSLAALAAAMTIGVLVAPAKAATISGTYFEDSANAACPAATSCTVDFPVLPAQLTGKFLLIETLMCAAGPLQGSWLGTIMAITDSGANPRRVTYFSAPPVGTRMFNTPVGQKVAGGPPRQLKVTAAFGGNAPAQIECTMIGTIQSQ